jgi:hypothetical protein
VNAGASATPGFATPSTPPLRGRHGPQRKEKAIRLFSRAFETEGFNK